jgi:hypothetical protein
MMPSDRPVPPDTHARAESLLCEHCGEDIVDIALAYQEDGDRRLYCSEKCLGKPGEAGDPNELIL